MTSPSIFITRSWRLAIMNVFIVLCFLFGCEIAAQSEMPEEKAQLAWKVVEMFEGPDRYINVGNDFDCHGMSIGAAQWNVESSFVDLRSILLAGGDNSLLKLMPNFGKTFLQALKQGHDQTKKYVVSLQTFQNPASCDAKVRKPKWTAQGVGFVKELKAILGTAASIDRQKSLQLGIARSGWLHATQWSETNRGPGAVPTDKEFEYFLDMQNFNGGGFKRFNLSYQAPTAAETDELISAALHYMATAKDTFLDNRVAAHKNSALIAGIAIPNNDRALFARAYQLSGKLNAKHARQFKLTVLNRRALILYGQAYISDLDKTPRVPPTVSGQPMPATGTASETGVKQVRKVSKL